ALERDTGTPRLFRAVDCGFGYRESIFRGDRRARVLIRRVLFHLPRGRPPETRYAALAEELRGHPAPTPAAVLQAVIAIRRRRLPDPAVLPNAGSFFKNPVVDARRFERMQASHPGLVHWRKADGGVKLAAAWLVEACGFKGCRADGAGVHDAQALVLVNHGGATAGSLLSLAGRIREAVDARFGVALEIEPVLC
ncbi:MAG: UDP-N-acetylenolpyruvoylglucosamine reductase, partial [Gammaproteobacteria bacterium]